MGQLQPNLMLPAGLQFHFQPGIALDDRLFREHAAPDDVPAGKIPAEEIKGEDVYLPGVIAALGLASSRTDARRLIGQGGVKLNGEPVAADNVPLKDLDGALLQVGKRRFVRPTL